MITKLRSVSNTSVQSVGNTGTFYYDYEIFEVGQKLEDGAKKVLSKEQKKMNDLVVKSIKYPSQTDGTLEDTKFLVTMSDDSVISLPINQYIPNYVN